MRDSSNGNWNDNGESTQTSTKKIVNEICDFSSALLCNLNSNLISSIVLFFTLHKAAKIRGRVTLNRGQLIVVLSKKRRAWSRSMAQISEWKFVSDSDWWKEHFFQLPLERQKKTTALWIENWILLWNSNGWRSPGGRTTWIPTFDLTNSDVFFHSFSLSSHKTFLSSFSFRLEAREKFL